MVGRERAGPLAAEWYSGHGGLSVAGPVIAPGVPLKRTAVWRASPKRLAGFDTLGRNSDHLRMKITVSEKGQVTIRKALRDRLGIQPGQVLDVREEAGRLVATKAMPESWSDLRSHMTGPMCGTESPDIPPLQAWSIDGYRAQPVGPSAPR